MHDKLHIELELEEAIILYEHVAKLEERKTGAVTAEDVVLWRIEGQLEKMLVEPFKPNYREIVDQARQHILDSATE